MILLAFSGSLLVGSDFRLRTLPFYLSRRIDKRHYIVGKLLAVSAIVSILTDRAGAAVVLRIRPVHGVDRLLDRQLADRGFGAGLRPGDLRGQQHPAGDDLGLLAADRADHDHLGQHVPAAGPPGRLPVSRDRRTRYWRLLDPWRDMRLVGPALLRVVPPRERRELAWWALAILARCAPWRWWHWCTACGRWTWWSRPVQLSQSTEPRRYESRKSMPSHPAVFSVPLWLNPSSLPYRTLTSDRDTRAAKRRSRPAARPPTAMPTRAQVAISTDSGSNHCGSALQSLRRCRPRT